MSARDTEHLEMPSYPKKKEKRGRLLLWIFIGLTLLAAGIVWLVRDVVLRDTTPVQQEMVVPEVLEKETAQTLEPQAGILDMIASDTPQESSDATAPNQDAEQDVVEEEEDSVITGAFIDDLAPWLVELYYPKGSHPAAGSQGIILVDPVRLNQRYGTTLTGISWAGDDIRQGRQAVLDYVFTPSMLKALYALYADRLMQSLTVAASMPKANGTLLTPEQISEMYALYANSLRGVSGVLTRITLMNDLERRVNAWREATSNATQANTEFMERLYAYEQARDAGQSAEASKAKHVMDTAGKRYQQAIVMRERARESLLEALRQHPEARRLDESSLLYIATWVQRRFDANPNQRDTIRTAASLANELASRLEKAAKGLS